MPDPWYPRAERHYGAASGYTRGRNRMRTVKCHYTAGVNSDALIANQGLAQWLVTRAGDVYQYAEADALCYDSGEFNDDGPGCEIEFWQEDVIFTDAARTATAGLVHWLATEWGVPLAYYDGARVAEGEWSGFIAHRALQQSQPHGDFWPVSDWVAMAGGGAAGAATATIRKASTMWWAIVFDNNGFPRTFRMAGWLKLDELGAGAPRGAYGIHQEALDSGWPISRLDNVYVLEGITAWDHLEAANATIWG